jgi:hypothetical protein
MSGKEEEPFDKSSFIKRVNESRLAISEANDPIEEHLWGAGRQN